MALCNRSTELFLPKRYFWSYRPFNRISNPAISFFSSKRISTSFSLCSRTTSEESFDGENAKDQPKRISKQSSWEAKDSQGRDYLYRLGKEADNMNIAVGAKAGIIDDLFVGTFLGKDSDIVFDYRQKVTRSFEYLQGDYYISPVFMDKVVCHIVKNYIAHTLNTKVPLILGIWGGKGQGKTFQTELIFRAMGIEPVIMSAGELESERAGEPGRLIRERYRTASQVVQNQGKMSCLMINDIDAGLGRFGNTQMTVNNQIVVGTLMNLSDNPTRVSIGQGWRESDVTHRIPIIFTGNDFSTIYAPLIRDGRMEKFYWQPNREDIVNIVYRMYEKDGISRDEVVRIVDTFPNQALDFYGALRSRTYDRSISKWINDIGGFQNIAKKLLKKIKDDGLPTFTPPKQTVEALLESGYSLLKEQQLIMETKLSKEYMKNIDG
ncbi:PREDICTED: ribulose bisphosphate carboxylase/oxygenase activase, chloroplastic isoform X2 [Nelumbo nucifera]|uniref:Ribulose bisphosphate carboxylase/oxygenase activase, chloroplastic n=1 Tax=Nelumbo nucifera TaxID=4432 RepID=A0A1U8Q650_NELNU|nr:PREDICTED: ribulose bisphosphate carboxylase/oxygenase activase, chloroplastic isoform X2 [Nelumbo nucifera]